MNHQPTDGSIGDTVAGTRGVHTRRHAMQYIDHPSTPLRAGLGSTSVMPVPSASEGSDQAGNAVGEAIGYFPYGETRAGNPGTLPTDYLFTGQRRQEPLGGLYHMGARFYEDLRFGFGRYQGEDWQILFLEMMDRWEW